MPEQKIPQGLKDTSIAALEKWAVDRRDKLKNAYAPPPYKLSITVDARINELDEFLVKIAELRAGLEERIKELEPKTDPAYYAKKQVYITERTCQTIAAIEEAVVIELRKFLEGGTAAGGAGLR